MRSSTVTSDGSEAYHGPLLVSGVSHALHLLDSAADHFIVHRDFQTSFGICEKGLAILVDNEKEDSR